jgi:uncharacterized protein YoxC
MQSKDYFKIKARKLAKQTWAGPGKFGVFIVLCIIVIAMFESLGLSNREMNLELRAIPLVAIQVNLKLIDEKIDSKTEDISYKINTIDNVYNHVSKIREEMLLYAAVDQLIYEKSNINSDNITSQATFGYHKYIDYLLKDSLNCDPFIDFTNLEFFDI